MRHIGILAVLFVVLLGAVIVKETSRPDVGSLRDQLPQQALGARAFEAADVARVVVTGPGGADSFTLLRGDGAWTVEEPFRAPAAAGVVDTFLAAVSAARGELRLDDAAALAKFDLTDERATRVLIEDAAGETLADFALGKTSGQRGAFVRPRFEGVRDGAYAVSQDLRGGLGLEATRPGDAAPDAPRPAHFHDLALAPFAVAGSMRVELATPNWTAAFEKRGPAWIAAEGAPNAPIRSQGIDQLVRQYGGSTSATALIDPANTAAVGLAEPAFRAQVVQLEGGARTAFGAADRDADKYYVRFDTETEPKVVYELTRYAFERLFPRGSTLFEFPALDADQLTRFEVKSDNGYIAMSRAGTSDDWNVTEPAWPLPPSVTARRSLGSALRGVRAVDWYAGTEAFRPQITITYGGATDAAGTGSVVEIGQDAPGGGGRLAKLPGSTDIAVLATSAVDRLQPETLSLYETSLFPGATADDVQRAVVRSINAADGEKTELFEVAAGDEGWTVTQGGVAKPGEDIRVRLWLESLVSVAVTTRSDDLGPFAREIEIHREGEDPVVIAIGDTSDLGTALRIGDVGFFASVLDTVTTLDPLTLVREETPATPEDGDDSSGDEGE